MVANQHKPLRWFSGLKGNLVEEKKKTSSGSVTYNLDFYLVIRMISDVSLRRGL